MKLAIYSDLHTEHSAFEPPGDLDVDLIVLAGDIHTPGHTVPQWARRADRFGDRPIVYVPGNHEFYNSEMLLQSRRMREEGDRWGVHVLESRAVIVDGVRFLGCTLWTDFKLRFMQSDERLQPVPQICMWEASRNMLDYAAIRLQRHRPSGHGSIKPLLVPADTLALHHAQRSWLASELATPFDGPTVVVTHHAPSRQSLTPIYENDVVSAAFVSELPSSFFDVPVLWVHGHTHTSFDYELGHCRVICNPRGYRLHAAKGYENMRFDPYGIGVDIGCFPGGGCVGMSGNQVNA